MAASRVGAGALALALMSLWCVSAQVLLPTPTESYSTVVSAGFGDLLFSLHYSEYCNSSEEISKAIGRFYSPQDEEWTDYANERYDLTLVDPQTGNSNCFGYSLRRIGQSRLVQPATAVLINLQADNVTFTNLGPTSVRFQQCVHFTTQLSWDTNVMLSPSMDQFLLDAYDMAGVDTSTAYSINATIDVYFASDSSGALLQAGGGAIPVRYTVTGSRADGNGMTTLNILYDFLQFSALDFATAARELADPNLGITKCKPEFISPPPLATGSLLPLNESLPAWFGGGIIAVELTASNHAPMQISAQQNLFHGEERLDFLADPNTNTYNSLLYQYDQADQRNFKFANGAVYTINQSLSSPVCGGQTISPASVSPLQGLDAASLNTIFADGGEFLSGAKSVGRQTIRAIVTDVWAVNKVLAYNGAIYSFTIQIYATANGWSNLGRTAVAIAPQVIRIAYNGTRTAATGGKPEPYWLQLDFFIQVFASFPDAISFDPTQYLCTIVSTGESILPQLPPQYSVSVSASWGFNSIQYTEYVDTQANKRRVDGRFAGPNTFALISPSSSGSSTDYMEEWTQNVTLAAGFSALTLNNAIPYTMFRSTGPPVACTSAVTDSSQFLAIANINFFDLQADADASQATYEGTVTHRGVDADAYITTFSYEFAGVPTAIRLRTYYLSYDETTTANIPLTAFVSIVVAHFPPSRPIQIQYEFYSFKQGLPAGIFASPALSSCSSNLILPPTTPLSNGGIIPDPSTDGTPMTAPVWPTSFSVLIEGQFFVEKGDWNVYTARWYVDFEKGRERLDIEPSFNISGVQGVTPLQASYIYYYERQPGATAAQFSFNNGIYVVYDGNSCNASSINATNVNPLKRVAPGNLFDTFFPATSQALSLLSSYQFRNTIESYWTDEYDWSVNTTFGGVMYQLTYKFFVSIPEWVNNAQALNYSYNRIPVNLQTSGNIVDPVSGSVLQTYFRDFSLSHFQPYNPGIPLFDAALLGCATTPDSPWYNIYNDQGNNLPSSSSSSSVSTALIVGVVVGVGGGLLLLIVFGLCYWKRYGTPLAIKYRGGAHRNTVENELAAGRGNTDDTGDASLNKEPSRVRQSVSHVRLVAEGGADAEETGAALTAPTSTTTSSDT